MTPQGTDWLAALARRLGHASGTSNASDAALVRVVVVATRGSAPREAGAVMLVDADTQHGTIGGGHLEYRAVEIARGLLAQGTAARLDRFSLGATLGQCCGGAVELWFERWDAADLPLVADLRARVAAGDAAWLETRLDPARPARRMLHDPAADAGVAGLPAATARRRDGLFIEPLPTAGAPLWLFGAGHVGAALVRVLAGLPFAVTWVDNRDEAFAAMLAARRASDDRDAAFNNNGFDDTSDRVTLLPGDDPAAEVASAPPGTHYLIMTHSHDLDQAICRAALARDDAAFVGVIGSATKAARFRHRLAAQGIGPDQLARLTCPIGSAATTSKLPAAIAVSVAAQLLEQLEVRAQAAPAAPVLRVRA